MLKSQLELRLKKLEASRQAMLRERNGYIANIQKGAYLLWKEKLDQLEQFIVLNLDWGTKLIHEFKANGEEERSEPPRRKERQGERGGTRFSKLLFLGGLAVNNVSPYEG